MGIMVGLQTLSGLELRAYYCPYFDIRDSSEGEYSIVGFS